VVYEVKGPQGVRQVDAITTAELKTTLTPLLDLDPYSVQAAAHLAHVERATVQGNGWSVRRLGVLSFVPDTANQKPEQKRRKEAGGSEEGSQGAEGKEVQTPPQVDVSRADFDTVLDRLTPATVEDQAQQPEETIWTP
jgi:hypothetical protein